MPDLSRDNKTKIKNRSGPRTFPCGIPVVTGIEQENILLHLHVILVLEPYVGFKSGAVFISHSIGTKFFEQKFMV